MEKLWRRLAWRPIFLAAVAIGAIILGMFARTSYERTELLRWTLVGVWVALAVLYALIAWRTRASSPEHRWFDVVIVGMYTVAAIYETSWPGSLPHLTPDDIVGIGSASGMGSYLSGAARRHYETRRSAIARANTDSV